MSQDARYHSKRLQNNNLHKESLATTGFLASFLPSVLMNMWSVLGFTRKVIQNHTDMETVPCVTFDHETVTFEPPRPQICGTVSNKVYPK